jgi:hypothetical protein
VSDRQRKLVVALAAFQVLDVVGNAVPRRFVAAHLDHLGVPQALRPMLSVMKLSSSAGLLAGLRFRRLGVLTSGALVAYYAAAARFHTLSGDHPALAAPAAGMCGVSAYALFNIYLPAGSTQRTRS